MRIFSCAHCGQMVYFENTHCENCGYEFGFNTQSLLLETFKSGGYGGGYYSYKGNQHFEYCSNHQYKVCNWVVPSGSANKFCSACQLNKTIPNISSPHNIDLWHKIEKAKHRLLFSLYRLNLEVIPKYTDPQNGLAFDFLENESPYHKVITGHNEGLITINIEEADDAFREAERKKMGEPYRTLLGHFRHEVGHYYWSRLIENTGWLYEFRNIFGNEQRDYNGALQYYYQFGAPVGWQQYHISIYASSHPWEDWAETWAHYLHMMDTLETAWSFGLSVKARNIPIQRQVSSTLDTDPYEIENFTEIITQWLPFTYAMNSINRSMGINDLYPFVMSDWVIKKLDFIHRICRSQKQKS